MDGGWVAPFRAPGQAMRVCRRWLLVAAAAVLLAGPAAAADPRATELGRSYGRLPGIRAVELSPRGDRVAFLRDVGDNQYVTVYDIDRRRTLFDGRAADQKPRALRWAGDEDVVLLSSAALKAPAYGPPAAEAYSLQLISLHRRRAKPLELQVPGRTILNIVNGLPEVRERNGRPELFVRGYEAVNRQLRPVLLAVEVSTGDARWLDEGAGSRADWLVDDDGHAVAKVESGLADGTWRLSMRRHDRWDTVLAGDRTRPAPRLIGMADDPGELIVSLGDTSATDWTLLPLATEAPGRPFPGAFHLRSPRRERTSARLLGGRGADDTSEVFPDADRQRQWDRAADGRGARVQFVSASDDFRRFVLRVDGTDDGYRYEYVELDTGRRLALGQPYPNARDVETPRTIRYPATDGLVIPAVLTLPHGRAESALPLVVLVHGGPADHADLRFSWWRAALVARGYAVLEPNFRGSDLTRSLAAAGVGQFGLKMQSDLTDGIRFLAQNGTIDAARVCIAGASYGGYAALEAAALDPDSFRCVVAVAAVSDLPTWMDRLADREGPEAIAYWCSLLGTPRAADSVVRERSPIYRAADFHTPVLLIHGGDDAVVPVEQSRRMNRALRAARRQVEYLELGGEDHWLSRSSTREQMLVSSLEFMAKYNPPGPRSPFAGQSSLEPAPVAPPGHGPASPTTPGGAD